MKKILAFGFIILILGHSFCTQASEDNNSAHNACFNFLNSQFHKNSFTAQTLKYPIELPMFRGLQESYYLAFAAGIPPEKIIERLSTVTKNSLPRYVSGHHEAYYFAIAIGQDHDLAMSRLAGAKPLDSIIRYNSSKLDAYYLALVLGFSHEQIVPQLKNPVPAFKNHYTRPGIDLAYHLAMVVGMNSQDVITKLLQSNYPPPYFMSTDGVIEAYYLEIVMNEYFDNL